MIADFAKKWRFWLVCAALAALFAALLARLLLLQVIDYGGNVTFLQGQGDARTVRTETVAANRGMITDRNGEPLAVSTPVVNIWANPRELDPDPVQLNTLAAALDYKPQNLQERLALYQGKQFVYLKRQVSPAMAQEILSMKIRGVYGEEEFRRFYPAGEVTAHVLGFTGRDHKGQEGLELAYEDWLQGHDGSNRVVQDLYRRTIKTLSEVEAARPGEDIALSLDLRIQHMAYSSLKTAIARHRAQAGTAIVLDVKTFEVLAMVNQPSFNPNNRRTLKAGNVRNRALIDVFEPGSTVKPFTALAALESGQFRPDTVIDTSPGRIRVSGRTLLDPVNYQELDLTGVIAKSSQVGTTKVALALEQTKVYDTFYRMGLGQYSGTGFPGETTGILPNRNRWSDIERANFAFGYGVSVTALQLAQAYAVLAGNGVKKPVSLLKQTGDEPGNPVADSDKVYQVNRMLEAAASHEGTGSRAQVDLYTVAGKTGTSHKIGPSGYEHGKYMSIFAGFAPAKAPRIVTVVVVDDPKGREYFGGEVAAPVFSEIISGSLRMLNVAPDKLPGLADVGHAGRGR